MRRVSIHAIETVLRRFKDRYRWLDVFSSQVDELTAQYTDVAFEPRGKNRFLVQSGSSTLDLNLLNENRVARWSLPDVHGVVLSGALVGGTVGGMIGSEQTRRSPDGLVLGLLAGAIIGDAVSPDRNRIMTLRYDSNSERWETYNGPYVQWAKEALRIDEPIKS